MTQEKSPFSQFGILPSPIGVYGVLPCIYSSQQIVLVVQRDDEELPGVSLGREFKF